MTSSWSKFLLPAAFVTAAIVVLGGAAQKEPPASSYLQRENGPRCGNLGTMLQLRNTNQSKAIRVDYTVTQMGGWSRSEWKVIYSNQAVDITCSVTAGGTGNPSDFHSTTFSVNKAAYAE